MARESQWSSYCVYEAMSSDVFRQKVETRKEVRDIHSIVADFTQQFRDNMIMLRQQFVEMIHEEASNIRSQSGSYSENPTKSGGSSPSEIVPVRFTVTDEAVFHGKAPDLIPDCLMVGTVIGNEGGDQSKEKNEEKGDSIDYCESDASPNRSGVRSNSIQPVDYQQSPTISPTTESNTSIPRFSPNNSPTIAYPSTIEWNKNREGTIERWSCFQDRHNWIWVPGEERNKDDKAHINEYFIVQAQTDILNWPKPKPESDTLNWPNSTPSLSTSDGRDGWSDDQQKLPSPSLPPPLPTWTLSPLLSPLLPPPPPWPSLLPPPLPRSPVLCVLTRWSPNCDGKSCNRCLEKAGRYPMFDTCLHVKETEKKSQIGEEEEDKRVDGFLKDRGKGSGDNKSIMNSSMKSTKSKGLDSSPDPCPAYMNRPNPKVSLPGELSSKPSPISSGMGIGMIPWIYDASVTRKEVSDRDHVWPNCRMRREMTQGSHNPILSRSRPNLGSIAQFHYSTELVNKAIWQEDRHEDLRIWAWDLLSISSSKFDYGPSEAANKLHVLSTTEALTWLIMRNMSIVLIWKCLLAMCPLSSVDAIVSRLKAINHVLIGETTVISKELLKVRELVVLAGSFERSVLHQYFKLFHEAYKEYVSKVYVEFTYHGFPIKKILEDQRARLCKTHMKLARAHLRKIPKEVVRLMMLVGSILVKIMWSVKCLSLTWRMKIGGLIIGSRNVGARLLGKGKSMRGIFNSKRRTYFSDMRDEEDKNLFWDSPDRSKEEAKWFYLFQLEGLGRWMTWVIMDIEFMKMTTNVWKRVVDFAVVMNILVEPIKRAMNEINAAARLRMVATKSRKTVKTIQIKRAKGKADSKFWSSYDAEMELIQEELAKVADGGEDVATEQQQFLYFFYPP